MYYIFAKPKLYIDSGLLPAVKTQLDMLKIYPNLLKTTSEMALTPEPFLTGERQLMPGVPRVG